MASADLITAVHSSGRQIVLAVTGGGGRALSDLLDVPGASRSVLEAIVPYSDASLAQWLGAAPEQACSESTARAMAMASLVRARRLAPQTEPERLLGVGCSASLATNRPKRGEHRIHVGVQTIHETTAYTLRLQKDRRDRDQEQQLAAALIVWATAQACGVEAAALYDAIVSGLTDEQIERQSERTLPSRTELILGMRRCAVVPAGSIADDLDEAATPRLAAVLAGAFNPPHDGHFHMAELAEQRLGQPVAWELSVANVDKPPLDFLGVRRLIQALRARDPQRLIALTHAPTFREKARLFPGAAFVVGADTIARIADLRYYDGEAARRDAAIEQIAERGCRFLVFGREANERFLGLAELDLPPALLALCDEVPRAEFAERISSTELRSAAEE